MLGNQVVLVIVGGHGNDDGGWLLHFGLRLGRGSWGVDVTLTCAPGVRSRVHERVEELDGFWVAVAGVRGRVRSLRIANWYK